jgi:molybdenum cofactor cytidylyltransferase
MSWKKPTAGIILAAGESIRFGQTKQLLPLKNKYMIEWVLEAALGSRLEQIILVLGHDHKQIMRALGTQTHCPRLRVCLNHEYKKGQSSSLKVGFSKMPIKFPSVMFLLGDQPMIDTETIDFLLHHFWRSSKDICVPVYQGKRGNPTIFSRKFYNHFLTIKGDIGARGIIKTNSERVLEVEVKNSLCFIDIDTEKDFEKLQSQLKGK